MRVAPFLFYGPILLFMALAYYNAVEPKTAPHVAPAHGQFLPTCKAALYSDGNVKVGPEFCTRR